MKTFTKILSALVALLGFSSCSTKVMYGQPSATFVIQGTVIDKDTKAPVEGVLIKINDDRKSFYESFLYKTSRYGTFDADMQIDPGLMTLRVIWQDIDRGIYKKDSLDITINSSDYKGGDGAWYYGSQTHALTFEIEKEKL